MIVSTLSPKCSQNPPKITNIIEVQNAHTILKASSVWSSKYVDLHKLFERQGMEMSRDQMIWGFFAFCLLFSTLKTNMALENPHVQQEIHLHSWWIFHCHTLRRGIHHFHKILSLPSHVLFFLRGICQVVHPKPNYLHNFQSKKLFETITVSGKLVKVVNSYGCFQK